MLKPRRIPAFLHDVFGEQLTLLEVLLVLFTGLGVTSLLILGETDAFRALPLWRSVLTVLLMVDIVAGCVANFTRSTSNYYAHRPMHRRIFIAIHVHLPVLAWLMGTGLLESVLIWAYTMIAVLIVNALHGHPLQLFMAACLLVMGISGILILSGLPLPLLVMGVLFLMKVVFSFGVDHYRAAAESAQA